MENSPKIPENNSKEQDYQRRGVALEANQLHGKELPPERIGHVLMSGEAKPETSPPSAATMSRRELLDASNEIAIDNTTLRHIYDTHLIGENGLRRLVHEHMRGGNIRESLHHEILEHATEFERDPQLRHRLLRHDQRLESVNLKDLLAKAGIVETEGSTKRRPAGAAKQPAAHPAKHLNQQARQRQLLDFAFIAIILILLILVILLAISRG